MTQEERIYEHLKQYKSITSKEAFKRYGSTRLSAVIFNLRKAGHDIGGKFHHYKNQYGNNTNYIEYTLNE